MIKLIQLFLIALGLATIIIGCVTLIKKNNTGYKNQIMMNSVCDEYLFYKKADVPIACYEYFGIK